MARWRCREGAASTQAVTGGIPSLDRTICWLDAAGNLDVRQTTHAIECASHSYSSLTHTLFAKNWVNNWMCCRLNLCKTWHSGLRWNFHSILGCRFQFKIVSVFNYNFFAPNSKLSKLQRTSTTFRAAYKVTISMNPFVECQYCIQLPIWLKND